MRAVAAEFLATALLLAVVVGSGIMGDRLSSGNVAVVLLANSLATGAGLVALVLTFGPVSGAHMNPAVTMVEAMAGALPWRRVPLYVVAQVVGAFAGVALAHAMFELPTFAASSHGRSGFAQALSEFVATFALVVTVLGCSRSRPAATSFAVGAVIVAGYWFTASTSFANPAVALARAATNTFAGIRPEDVLAFVVAQLLGAGAAFGVFAGVIRPCRDS
jgi:glycerol uptake facilitator-like aquaporin